MLIKTEKSGFVILPPQSTYTGKGVENYDYAGNNASVIDGGKIDGVITSSGEILKVSDKESQPVVNVSVVICDSDSGIQMRITKPTTFINEIGNMLKKVENKFKNTKKELSGFYNVNDGSQAGKWIFRAPSQEEMRDILGDNKSYFINRDILEEHLKEE